MRTPLIAMAVHDTPENGRYEYTVQTIDKSLMTTDAFVKPWIINNGNCDRTRKLLRSLETRGHINLIELPENVGTAKAINMAWQHRLPDQHCVKMDNDVVIHSDRWLYEMQDAMMADPTIGILGLKRKDCWENPNHPDPFYRSQLRYLPHVAGQRWVMVEEVNHVMGTCQMYSPALLDKIGYLYQPRLYGFDDALAAVRCQLAGFKSAFLPHIDIDHIDRGDTAYQGWKEKHAGEDMIEFNRLKDAYRNGSRPIFEPATW